MNCYTVEDDRIKFQYVFARRVWGEDRKKKSSETPPEFEELYREPCGLGEKWRLVSLQSVLKHSHYCDNLK